MPMHVVHIGYVGMRMFGLPVFVKMSMGLNCRFGAAVLVLMMYIV